MEAAEGTELTITQEPRFFELIPLPCEAAGYVEFTDSAA